jgi:hypothetical protein
MREVSMEGIRRHLTYANVVATMALLVAIAGGTTAIAVSKGKSKGTPVRVTKSSDITKNGSIKPGRVTDVKLAPNSVTASKLAGIDVVQQAFASTGTVPCPAGKRLIGGGAKGNPELGASFPDGNGWRASTETSLTEVTGYALCLKESPGS